MSVASPITFRSRCGYCCRTSSRRVPLQSAMCNPTYRRDPSGPSYMITVCDECAALPGMVRV